MPTISNTSPADNDINIAINSQVVLEFDAGIDSTRVKNAFMLTGPDTDIRTGPDNGLWLRPDGTQPYGLSSPGFRGETSGSFALQYVNKSTGVAYTSDVTALADETSNNIGHQLTFTPTGGLAENTTYELFLIGDPDSISTGLASRSVFDPLAGVGNTSTTGTVLSKGTWEGLASDSIVVTITLGGDIGTVRYSWYLASAPGNVTTGRKASRNWRALGDTGVQIRFDGTTFVASDEYTIALEPKTHMASNLKITFTTGSGVYGSAPNSPSTPAEQSPPNTVLPGFDGATNNLLITDSSPVASAYNVSTSTSTIYIDFSSDLDASTITDANITVTAVPIDCVDSPEQSRELVKSVAVDGSVTNRLVIKI